MILGMIFHEKSSFNRVSGMRFKKGRDNIYSPIQGTEGVLFSLPDQLARIVVIP